jgi:hypothetical protein
MTIVAYIVIFIAVFFSVTMLAIGPLCVLLVRLTGLGMEFSSFLSYVVIWLLMPVVWRWMEGGIMPIAAFAGSFLIALLHTKDPRLNRLALSMRLGESWAIIIAAIYVMYNAPAIRWY